MTRRIAVVTILLSLLVVPVASAQRSDALRLRVVGSHTLSWRGALAVLELKGASGAQCELRFAPSVPTRRTRCQRFMAVRVGASAQRMWTGFYPELVVKPPRARRHVLVAEFEQEPNPLHGAQWEAFIDPLERCGRSCFRPFSRRIFPAWGNRRLGDCQYAALADWLTLSERTPPSESSVLRSFAKHGAMGGTDFFAMLASEGVAGARIARVPVSSTRGALEAALKQSHVLYAGINVPANTTVDLGGVPITGASHAVVLDGFTPRGVQIVSWGRTSILPWSEWEAAHAEAWRLTPIQ